MNNNKLKLSILQETLAVCKLASKEDIPAWPLASKFFSATRTSEELSIICEEAAVPAHVTAEKGWRAFKVEGPLDFALTGILASIANPLAVAGISIFAISTFDTDYILVKNDKLHKAKEVLSKYFDV